MPLAIHRMYRTSAQEIQPSRLASGETNQLHQFLDKILLKLTYEKWFFGCYHRDVQLSTKSRCVFCDVIPMGERRTGLFRR